MFVAFRKNLYKEFRVALTIMYVMLIRKLLLLDGAILWLEF